MKGWNPEEWHQQMYAEVAVAYRLSELGSLSEDGPYDPNDIKEIDTEFHAWLNEIKARERKETEQRIIKLLDERLAMLKLDGSTLPFGEHELRLLFAERCIELSVAIALIKGEK